MAEHRIRFRGGWESSTVGNPALSTRLTLPTDWSAGRDEIVRLVRRFGRPRTAEVGETYRLELRGVPGLIGLSLNGRDLAGPAGNRDDLVVPLDDPLLERNELTIEVDVGRAARSISRGGWGSIALVIGSGLSEPGSSCHNESIGD